MMALGMMTGRKLLGTGCKLSGTVLFRESVLPHSHFVALRVYSRGLSISLQFRLKTGSGMERSQLQ